jgi:hypothetical protein
VFVCLQVITADMHGYMIAVNSSSVEQIQNAKQSQFNFWRQLHQQQQQSYHNLSRGSPHLSNAAAGGMQAGGTQQTHSSGQRRGQPRSQHGASSRFCTGKQHQQQQCCHSTAQKCAATGACVPHNTYHEPILSAECDWSGFWNPLHACRTTWTLTFEYMCDICIHVC